MKKISFFCYFFSIVFVIRAQKENNIWVLGDSVGIDFNTNPPTSFTTSLPAYEACASVSDRNGKLLFYTNGQTVYNKNHSIMMNGTGLVGDLTSSQTIIVPKPKSSSIYYIFSVDPQGQGQGFRYSEVDMTLDNGLGGITTNKNIALHNQATERMTAVRHKNNVDIWVISQNLAVFKAYLITCGGINKVAISSPLLKIIQSVNDFNQTIGQMKMSSNGTKLACTVTEHDALSGDTGRVEIYNFNRETGTVTNGKFYKLYSPYGIEFSPNERFLYVSSSHITGNNVYQYDLSIDSLIEESKVVVSLSFNPAKGALQLAPNGSIYTTILGGLNSTGALAIIRFPNFKGDSCDYNLIEISPQSTDTVKVGLPQKVPSQPIMDTIYLCENDTYTFNGTSYNEEGIYYDTISGSKCDSVINYFELKVKKLPKIENIESVMDCEPVILPQIVGENLTGTEAYFTGELGKGTRFEIGDTIFSFIELFAYDESYAKCNSQEIFEITQCNKPLPNIFTPNNDNYNDVFKIQIPDVNKYDFAVYNRWGKQVYFEESYSNDWDGNNLPDGIYYYTISHQEIRDVKKGWFSLMR